MKVITSYPTNRFSNQLQQILKTNIPYILHIWDVCDVDYIDYVNNSQNPPRYIVNDSLNFIQVSSGVCYGSNFWLEKQIKDFVNIPYDSELTTKHIFNFVINKKQINRYLCIKLIELFELTDYQYTWSGSDQYFDMTNIVKELNALGNNSPLTELQRSFLMSPISITPNFIKHPGHMPYALWIWQNGFNSIFGHSAVSLITESVRYDRSMTFSEKTLFSVLGLTFPIWVGGYKQADEWKRTGFDAFDDVINHDYQYFDTLIERCYYAVQFNLELLSDKNKASTLRTLHKERLLNNRKLILNKQIDRFNDSEVRNWPAELQKSVMPVLIEHFR